MVRGRRAVAVLVLMWLAHAAPALADSGHRTPPSGVAEFNRTTLVDLGVVRRVDRDQFIIVQATEAKQIRALKRAHPNVKVLLYVEPLLARPTDPEALGVCSSWPRLIRDDPTWLLHDQNGDPIEDAQFAANDLMDIGNPAYQRSCIRRAIHLARRVGADGVFLDDTNASIDWDLPAGVSVPEYPTVSSWQAAETSWLRYASAQLHAQHLLAVANIGGARITPGLWQRWNSIVDGAMEQEFNDWSEGTATLSAQWPTMLAEAAWSQAHGKYALLQASDSGQAQNTFGLATMMLVADGQLSYCGSEDASGTSGQWYRTYGAAQALGAPLSRRIRLGDGLYVRRFEHGMVVVNPTTGGLAIRLAHPLRDAASGRWGAHLSVAPLSAEILLDD